MDTPRRDHRQITLLDLATHTSGLPRSGWALIRQSIRNRREPFAAFDPGRDAAVVLLFNSRYLLRTARTALGLLGSLGE